MKRLLRVLLICAVGISLLWSAVGCESKAATGAMIGGGAGAGLGAIIGHNSHHRTAEGALIGGAVGAIAGGLIGNEADRRDRRYREDYRYYEPAPRPYYAPAPPPPVRYERDYYRDHDGYYESYREERYYGR